MNIKITKYIEQTGCHNCKNCFVFREWDSILEYYCNINNDRPKCGSVGMNEKFDFKNTKFDEWDIWSEWSKNNKVEPWGICNNFEKLNKKG